MISTQYQPKIDLGDLDYTVGPYGATDVVVGPPCAAFALVLVLIAEVWAANN